MPNFGVNPARIQESRTKPTSQPPKHAGLPSYWATTRRAEPPASCLQALVAAKIASFPSAHAAHRRQQAMPHVCIRGLHTMPQTLGAAAKAVGKNRTTLLRAVKSGKLSATYDDALGGWLVEPAELHRIF